MKSELSNYIQMVLTPKTIAKPNSVWVRTDSSFCRRQWLHWSLVAHIAPEQVESNFCLAAGGIYDLGQSAVLL